MARLGPVRGLPRALRFPYFYSFVVLLWLRRILGKACKRLPKIKFLKSELNRPEPKPAEGHGKASPEFWGDELRFASYGGRGSRQGCQAGWTLARARERFCRVV